MVDLWKAASTVTSEAVTIPMTGGKSPKSKSAILKRGNLRRLRSESMKIDQFPQVPKWPWSILKLVRPVSLHLHSPCCNCRQWETAFPAVLACWLITSPSTFAPAWHIIKHVGFYVLDSARLGCIATRFELGSYWCLKINTSALNRLFPGFHWQKLNIERSTPEQVSLGSAA